MGAVLLDEDHNEGLGHEYQQLVEAMNVRALHLIGALHLHQPRGRRSSIFFARPT